MGKLYFYHPESDCAFSVEDNDTQLDEISEQCDMIIHKKYVILKMLQKYGEDSQIDVAIEEMSELIKELIKYKRTKIHERERDNSRVQHVLEEIGDVMFMFEYLKTIFYLSDEDIRDIIEQKAKRTEERYL